MNLIYWDDKIAAKDQQYTNNCEFKHSPRQSRKIDNMDLGENIYFSNNSDKSENPNNMDWESEIKDWYSETKYFKNDIVNSFNSNGPNVLVTSLRLSGQKII